MYTYLWFYFYSQTVQSTMGTPRSARLLDGCVRQSTATYRQSHWWCDSVRSGESNMHRGGKKHSFLKISIAKFRNVIYNFFFYLRQLTYVNNVPKRRKALSCIHGVVPITREFVNGASTTCTLVCHKQQRYLDLSIDWRCLDLSIDRSDRFDSAILYPNCSNSQI